MTALADSGSLRPGQRIPSVRAMAHQMGLSVMTVLEGYRRLEDLGVVESRPQSGYYLRRECTAPSRPGDTLPALPGAEPIPLSTRAVRLPDWVQVLFRLTLQPNLLALGAGAPAPELLPVEALRRHTVRALREQGKDVYRYSMGSGITALREQLAIRMIDAGCEVGPGEILVTVGATAGLLASLRALTSPNDVVAVESPGYIGFYGALEFLGLKSLEIPTDPGSGLSLVALREALSRRQNLRAVLLCPTLSNPTGATMPDDAKRELALLCRRAGVAVIEDDTYGELCFAERRSLAVKSLDPDNVVYVGTLSKVLAPGYRVGWVAGGSRHRDIVLAQRAMVMAVPGLTQLGTASLLATLSMSRHLRRLRRRLSENMALCQRLVAEAFPRGTRAARPEGGHLLWVELPEGGDAVTLAEQAVQHGFTIAPGVLFSSRAQYRRFLRLNTALPWSPRLRAAVETLGSLAREQLQHR